MARSIFLGKKRGLCLRRAVHGKMPDNAFGRFRHDENSNVAARFRHDDKRQSHRGSASLPFIVIPEAACGYPGSSRTQHERFGKMPDNASGVSGMTAENDAIAEAHRRAAAVIPNAKPHSAPAGLTSWMASKPSKCGPPR